jgi:hypothetical protein
MEDINRLTKLPLPPDLSHEYEYIISVFMLKTPPVLQAVSLLQPIKKFTAGIKNDLLLI